MNGLWYAFLISIFQVSLLAWCPCTLERSLPKTWEASWGSCPAFSFVLGFSQLKSWACMNFWGRCNSILNFYNLFNIIQLYFHKSYEIDFSILLKFVLFFSWQEEHWPLFLSLVVVPTFIQLMLLPWFPESPRYLLIEKHNVHATITGERNYFE